MCLGARSNGCAREFARKSTHMSGAELLSFDSATELVAALDCVVDVDWAAVACDCASTVGWVTS